MSSSRSSSGSGLGDDAIAIFARDVGTGTLTFIDTVDDGVGGVNGLDGVISLAFAPGGTHLYAAGNAERAIAAFSCDPTTGLLTFVEVETDGVGAANGVAIRPDGHEVFVSGPGDSAVVAFTRNAATGRLAVHEAVFDGNGAAGIGGATGIAVSPGGAHLYVTGTTDDAVAVFAINVL